MMKEHTRSAARRLLTGLMAVLLLGAAGCSPTARANPSEGGPTPSSLAAETDGDTEGGAGGPDVKQTPAAEAAVLSGGRRVAYFTSWSAYERGLSVMDMDPSLLTHVNLAFANLSDTGEIHVGDSWADTEMPFEGDSWEDAANSRGHLGQFRRMKQKFPHIKTLVSVGGWTWSTNFSAVAANETSRKRFASSAVTFLTTYGLDGLDVDWEFPVEGGNGIAHRAEDKQNYTALLRETRAALDEQGKKDGKHYLLSIAGGQTPSFIQNTELKSMMQYLDYINIMAYDYHGAWETVTGHNAPLYATDGLSVSDTVDAYLAAGVSPGDLNLGLAFYGRGWTGVSGAGNGLGQRGAVPTGTGTGQGTWEGGVFDYWDLAQNYVEKNGYKRYFDNAAKAPYLYNGSVFISYDDSESIRLKLEFARQKGLGGIMFWEFCGDKQKELQKLIADFYGNAAASPSSKAPAAPAPAPQQASSAGAPQWDPTAVYEKGDSVQWQGKTYRAKWWTQNEKPDAAGEWGPWEEA